MKKQFRKRAVSILLLVCILLSAVPAASAYTHPQGLWEYNSKWSTAVENNDYATIRDLSWKIAALYEGESLVEGNCLMLSGVSYHAAEAYRQVGDLETAVYWLEQQIIYDTWLTNNTRPDYETRVILAESLAHWLSIDMEIYTTAYEPADVPYYGAIGEPEVGTLQGSAISGSLTYSESASLIYVEFDPDAALGMEYWVKYYAARSGKSYDVLGADRVVELAWNFPFAFDPDLNDQLTKIGDGTYDSYIRKSAQYLGTLDCDVILRIGGEMNDWDDISPSAFISAFRRITTIVREETSNVATLYSPLYIGQWGTDYHTFYPGDEYVDWVGLSYYFSTSEAASSAPSNAYYGKGEFARNTVKYAELLAESFPNKPILLGEVGAAPSNGGAISQEERLGSFLAYVNMVVPQVKGVLYFDALDHQFVNNPTLKAVYTEGVSNSTYLTTADATAKGYTRLDSMAEQTDTLELYTYALFPSYDTGTCVYYLDGNKALTTTEIPYRYDVDVASLSVGEHTVRADVTCGNISRSVTRTFYVTEDGTVLGEEQMAVGAFHDVGINKWYYSTIYDAVEYGLVSGKSSTEFAPEDNVTRAEFLTIMRNLAGSLGVDVTAGSSDNFKDVDYSLWYGPVVNWAYESGVANGYDDGTFKPEANITRQEIAAIIVKFAEYADLELTTTAGYTAYGDQSSIGSWALPSVQAVTKAGIMQGSDGKFYPTTNTNRAEAATIAVRLYEQYR